MNKNNFMKALSMIDEDLMEQASSPDTDAIVSEKDDNLYSGNDSEMMVSGVDVYHRPVWRKVLTVAATFIIVVGIAGSGAYYFSRLKSNKYTLNNVEDDIKYDSIYSKLKDNKNKYKLSTAVRVFGSSIAGFPNVEDKEKERFFEYLDSFDMKTELEDNEFTKVPKSIAFCFGTDEEVYFTFELYENGCFTWTENNNGTDKITYHRFSEENMAFYVLSEMFELDSMESDLNRVSKEELESFIDTNFSKNSPETSYKNNGNISLELDIIDKDAIKETISSLEWERTVYSSDDDYSYCISGISLLEYGVISGNYNDYNVAYSLKDSSDIEFLSKIWKDYIKIADSETDDLNTLLQKFSNETIVQWFEGPTYIPQGDFPYDTKARYYSISDSKNFINEIASFEWVNYTSDEIENNFYTVNDGFYNSTGYYGIGIYGYGGNLRFHSGGYMSIDEIGEYKLKNESDVESFNQVLNKYFLMDESSELAEKICKGITDYNNLKAHYTYESTYSDGESEVISGYLSVDAKNEKMHMTGEGTIFWDDEKNVTTKIVMNGHDESAFTIIDKDTSESIYFGTYSYSNGYAVPPPMYHYIYLCKRIEKELTPRMAQEYANIDYDINVNKKDGNSEITVYCKDVSVEGYYEYKNSTINLVLNEKGQILSYEYITQGYKEAFKLDDYVFDSPDFIMEDTESIYNSIKTEQESEEDSVT